MVDIELLSVLRIHFRFSQLIVVVLLASFRPDPNLRSVADQHLLVHSLLFSEEAVAVEHIVAEVDVETVALLHEQPEHVRFGEFAAEVEGAVVVAEASDVEIKKLHGRLMVLEGDILYVHIEHFVPVFLDKRKVHRMRELHSSGRVPGDLGDLPGDVGEVEVLHGVDDVAGHLHRAVVRVLDGVRVLFLDHNLEVVVAALIPNTIRSENQSVRVVVEVQEGRVRLVGHLGNVHLRHVVAFLVFEARQLVLVDVVHAQSPCGLDLFYEVRISVVHYFNVEVELD
mmetsp:Transcript_12357/g.19193  ORF Transcript_12357/g.19193 Transcript_12357/m.19193 type:complete len:283 (-) Transcript_12357:1889-2737(-)